MHSSTTADFGSTNKSVQPLTKKEGGVGAMTSDMS